MQVTTIYQGWESLEMNSTQLTAQAGCGLPIQALLGLLRRWHPRSELMIDGIFDTGLGHWVQGSRVGGKIFQKNTRST